MKKFLQKILCKYGAHADPVPEAEAIEQDDGAPAVRIRIFCPICNHSMMWIDVSGFDSRPPRFTHRGETLH